MMRQIKFRFWNPVNKEWISNAMIEIDSKAGFFHLTGEEFVPLQFTGLKDKNGVEIYEGDILFNDMIEWNYSVSWDDLLFAFILNHDEIQTFIFLYEINEDINCYKVIGNIYENPNLLEK